MLAVTQVVIRELTLVAEALGRLTETSDPERARDTLMASVEAIGQVAQRVLDLEFLIRSRTIELEMCQAEVARLKEVTAVDGDRFDHLPPLSGSQTA